MHETQKSHEGNCILNWNFRTILRKIDMQIKQHAWEDRQNLEGCACSGDPAWV